jgi:heptosyltransferase-2
LTDVVAEMHAETPVYRTLEVAGTRFTRKEFPNTRHQVHRYLDLISYLGGNRDLVQPRIWVAPGEIPALTKFLREDSRPFCGINAGAEFGPAKRWLPERFAEAALRIGEEYPCRWLIFGSQADQPIAAAIEQRLRAALPGREEVVNVAGQTSLLELCELIKFCRLLLTNDTGPMHLAYALGTPLVAVFGSTSPELTGPIGPHNAIVRAHVECTPCFQRVCPIDFRCMSSITTDQVVSAALHLLGVHRPQTL